MAEADVRQAIYAAFHELERGIVNLLLDENPNDLNAAIAQMRQLQPKHRPLILPPSMGKKSKPKKHAAPHGDPHAPSQQPRAPQLRGHDPSLPSRGWWPVTELPTPVMSDTERSELMFVCEMFPDLEPSTASAVLHEAEGNLERAVALLAALEPVALDSPMDGDSSTASLDSSLPQLPSSAFAHLTISDGPVGRKPIANSNSNNNNTQGQKRDVPAIATEQEAFPALVHTTMPTLDPNSKLARKAVMRMKELFPLVSEVTLRAALEKHKWNTEATADELFSEPEPVILDNKASSEKRMTWQEMQKLVKRPAPRPFMQLINSNKPPPPPPLIITPPPPTAAASGGAVPSVAKSDLSTQLKWRMLRQRVPWVEEEVLESVWVFSNYSLLRTLHALAALYPEPFLHDLLPSLSPLPSSNSSSISLFSPSSPLSPSSTPHVPLAQRLAPDAHGASSAPVAGGAARPNSALAMRRHLLCNAAAKAFVAGNGARAKQLAAEAREAADVLRVAHDASWRAAHHSAVRRGSPLLEVDLHGLTVDDALDVVARVMAHMREALQGDPSRPRMLSLITGVGKHSVGGQARIRPAVLAHLKAQGISHNEARTGQIIVRV